MTFLNPRVRAPLPLAEYFIQVISRLRSRRHNSLQGLRLSKSIALTLMQHSKKERYDRRRVEAEWMDDLCNMLALKATRTRMVRVPQQKARRLNVEPLNSRLIGI
jgi:hypothetical protein